jgi:uncharacterized protein (TIGR00369 family)
VTFETTTAILAEPSVCATESWQLDLLAQGWKQHRLAGHMGQLGPLWSCRTQAGGWRYGVRMDERHLNPAGIVHGGVLVSVLDHAISAVAWQLSDRVACVTLQLDSHFMAAVHKDAFAVVDVDLVSRSKSMLFMRAQLSVDGQVAVSAQAVMKQLQAA